MERDDLGVFTRTKVWPSAGAVLLGASDQETFKHCRPWLARSLLNFMRWAFFMPMTEVKKFSSHATSCETVPTPECLNLPAKSNRPYFSRALSNADTSSVTARTGSIFVGPMGYNGMPIFSLSPCLCSAFCQPHPQQPELDHSDGVAGLAKVSGEAHREFGERFQKNLSDDEHRLLRSIGKRRRSG